MNRKNYFAPTVAVEVIRAEQGFAVSNASTGVNVNGNFTEENVYW